MCGGGADAVRGGLAGGDGRRDRPCRAGAAVPYAEGFDVYGVGLGVETLVGPLLSGMVLGVRGEVDGYIGTDTVLVTDGDPEVLTHLSA